MSHLLKLPMKNRVLPLHPHQVLYDKTYQRTSYDLTFTSIAVMSPEVRLHLPLSGLNLIMVEVESGTTRSSKGSSWKISSDQSLPENLPSLCPECEVNVVAIIQSRNAAASGSETGIRHHTNREKDKQKPKTSMPMPYFSAGEPHQSITSSTCSASSKLSNSSSSAVLSTTSEIPTNPSDAHEQQNTTVSIQEHQAVLKCVRELRDKFMQVMNTCSR